MNTGRALQLALELQEQTLEIQQGLQALIRELAEEANSGNDADVRSTGRSDGRGGRVHSLADLDQGDFRFTKPARICFPDESEERVETWKQFVVSLVGWLVDKGRIDRDVPTGGRREYPTVARVRSNLTQTHGDPDTYLVRHDDYWIDTWGNVNTKARNLVAICSEIGVDPTTFRVVLRNGR